jgi:hypothetical protein
MLESGDIVAGNPQVHRALLELLGGTDQTQPAEGSAG